MREGCGAVEMTLYFFFHVKLVSTMPNFTHIYIQVIICVFPLYCKLIFQAECYHSIFFPAIKLHQLGFDWATRSHGPSQILQRVLGGYQNAEVTAKARTSSDGIESPRVSFQLFCTMWYNFITSLCILSHYIN